MVIMQAVVISQVGLHARPASLLVKCASRFRSQITIRKTDLEGPVANAKSILHVLSLGAAKGDKIELACDGEDEQVAAETLQHLIETDFQEVDEALS